MGAQRVKKACVAFRNFCEELNAEGWVIILLPFSFCLLAIEFEIWKTKVFLYQGGCLITVAWDVYNK
jgi:hypothetical protein